jgi:hypothetical protein
MQQQGQASLLPACLPCLMVDELEGVPSAHEAHPAFKRCRPAHSVMQLLFQVLAVMCPAHSCTVHSSSYFTGCCPLALAAAAPSAAPPPWPPMLHPGLCLIPAAIPSILLLHPCSCTAAPVQPPAWLQSQLPLMSPVEDGWGYVPGSLPHLSRTSSLDREARSCPSSIVL